MKLTLNDTGIPTPEQRKEFYQYCHNVYTRKVGYDVTFNGFELFSLGFCYIFYSVFESQLIDIKTTLPELYKHKPNVFYTYFGDKTDDDFRFWFPIGQNEERIKILEKILSEDF